MKKNRLPTRAEIRQWMYDTKVAMTSDHHDELRIDVYELFSAWLLENYKPVADKNIEV